MLKVKPMYVKHVKLRLTIGHAVKRDRGQSSARLAMRVKPKQAVYTYYIYMSIYVYIYIYIYVYIYIYIYIYVYISADPGRRKGERARE